VTTTHSDVIQYKVQGSFSIFETSHFADTVYTGADGQIVRLNGPGATVHLTHNANVVEATAANAVGTVIQGFRSSDGIDILDFAPGLTKLSYAGKVGGGGIMTLTSGSASTHIALADGPTALFASSDGHGGTFITDLTRPSPPPIW
jgi:hypothetical protein